MKPKTKLLQLTKRSWDNKNKTITSISEIPVSFKVSTLFGVTGFVSGVSLLFIPRQYIETDIDVPFPNITNIMKSNIDYKLIATYLACCSVYGYIGGTLYQYKTFKLGDSKRFYKVLNNLVHKTPLALTHCAGFTMVIFYGMFGMFTLFETLLFSKPFGLINKNDDYDHLLGYNKSLLHCNHDEIKQRCKFALEITAHWMHSTIFVVLPIFLFGSSALFVSHRTYWLSLFSRLKRP